MRSEALEWKKKKKSFFLNTFSSHYNMETSIWHVGYSVDGDSRCQESFRIDTKSHRPFILLISNATWGTNDTEFRWNFTLLLSMEICRNLILKNIWQFLKSMNRTIRLLAAFKIPLHMKNLPVYFRLSILKKPFDRICSDNFRELLGHLLHIPTIEWPPFRPVS